jgi:hypothetical protein
MKPNEISQDELIKMGRLPEPESQIRELIVDGCPAAVTLTRLEIPGSTGDRRFSFMYPYVAIDGYASNYMYIHCEMKLRPTGFKPDCSRPQGIAAGQGNGGLMNEDGNKLGNEQFMQRSYGGAFNGKNNAYKPDHNMMNKSMFTFLKENNLDGLHGGSISHYTNEQKRMNEYEKMRKFQNTASVDDINKQNLLDGLMFKSSQGGAPTNNGGSWEGFSGRRRRSVNSGLQGKPDGYSVSVGPMIIITDNDIDPSDVREIVMKTKMPLLAMPDGTIGLDETA